MSNPPDSLHAYRGGKPYAFISYARADRHLVFPILQALQDRGFRIWFDEGIKPMDEWMDRLASAIDGAEIFVLFASKVSVSRPNVIREIGRAAEDEKPFCTVGLEPMQLPRAIAFAVGKDQHVAASERNRADVVADLVDAFDGYNIREDGVSEPVSAVRTSTRHPVPLRARRQGQRMQVQDSFADRVPESEALLRSVDRQLRRLRDEEPIEPEVFPNVLVFYGGSGLGKTGLSKRLELWVSHGLAESIEWGEWPHEDVVSVRWDFHEAEGNLNLLAMLRALRAALTRSKVDWRAFDIGLAAYLEACRFGEQNALGLSGDVEDEVLRSFQIVASELRMAPPSDLAPSDVRRIVREVRESRGHGGSLDDYDALFTLLDAVQDLSRGGHAAEAASDLMYLLTEVIGVLPPEERPLLLFFVDPFERIQRGSETGHEEAIAQFVADLPFALFVITGRDKLKWAEENRTGLPFAGPSYWPGLTSGDPMPPEPRQHLLGRLSDEDTRRLYEMNRAAEDWRISEDLISELVIRSAGLPLHIDAVLKLALRLNARLPGREFTADDLSGELPDVVQRLIRTLSPAEARAFRAACVLPSFDIQLAAAVAGVDAADVERAIRFALVERDDGLAYPYRVHDEIRRLVKLDRDSEGYWSLADWESAARRGLHEAIARIKAGHESGSDAEQLQGIALAIRLGYEWDIYPEGLAKIVNDGPSIAVLAPLIPPESVVESDSAISDFIRLVHALALPFDAGAARLLSLHPTDPEVAHFTMRWAMYRSRSVSRFDEAMRAASLLVESAPAAFAKVSRYQYAVTLRICRKFADSEGYVKAWRPDRIDRSRAVVDRLHGVANYDPTELARISGANTSRRFRLELEINDLVRNARFKGDLDVDRINVYLERSINLGQISFQRDCLLLLGYANLGNRAIFDGLVDDLRNHESYDYSAYAYCQLLALRALYLGDRDVARPAYEEIISRERSRNAFWISAEVWLEALGFDIPPEETQWLMPYEDVRANWMMVADRLIRQAKARSGEAAELGS